MSSKVGFFCRWTIENFGFCEERMLSSPCFTVNMLNDTRWNLCLRSRLDSRFETYYVCMLKRNDKRPNKIAFFYEISIIIGNEQKCMSKYVSPFEVDFEANSFGEKVILMRYIDYDENFKDNFEKETLIICCHMWKAEMAGTIKYFIRTPVKTHKRYLKAVLKHIYSLNKEEYLLKYSDRDSSPYKLKLNFNKHGSFRLMHTYIYQMEPYRIQEVKCKISLMDTEEKILVSKQGKNVFNLTETVWNFPRLESQWILSYKDSLLPNNTLYLLVEMQLNGIGLDEMEQINFGDGFDELLVSSKDSKDQTTQSNNLSANSLMNNLLNFYNDGKLCDVVLKTDSSSFPVHKVILCAQSPVFTTMLETNLMEKQTGMIPIPNMSDDTVKKMIMFIYTDQVEGLDFEGAVNLYLASDQYDIVQLKQLCRDFLKSNLDISNITDALVVADLHQDEELKNASHDFIFEHDSEVIASDKWNQFMQDHLKLAAETLQFMYSRKLGK